MPELPEVETLKRILAPSLVGRRIVGAEATWPNMLSNASLKGFSRELEGCVIEGLDRRGKFLIMRLRQAGARGGIDKSLIMHLRMSGNLNYLPENSERAPHDRVVLTFENGCSLRFNDPRKFGRLSLAADFAAALRHLGPEPIDPAFSARAFAERIAGKRGALKPLLLNQSFIAGVGNIYADESLWRSRIHPTRAADTLEPRELDALFAALRKSLLLGIEHSGTDSGDGVVPYGKYSTRVYGREGRPCYRCGSEIVKTTVGQRGTHFCPECQPPPRRNTARRRAARST